MSLSEIDSLLALVEPEGAVTRAAFRFPENATCCHFGPVPGSITDDDANTRSQANITSKMIDNDTRARPFLALSFHPGPKDLSRGFIFGSNPGTCDVLLAKDNRDGMSGNHFSINVDWPTGNPLVTCLTPNQGTGIRVLLDGVWTLYLRGESKMVKPGTSTALKISEDVKLVVHSPVRASREPAYSINLQRYFKKCQDFVPEMNNLKLYDEEPTPLLIARGRGLSGRRYFTTSTFIGDKVILCEAADNPNGTQDSEKFIIKRFRIVQRIWRSHVEKEISLLRTLRHQRVIAPVDIISEGTEYMPVYLPEPLETLADIQMNEQPLTENDAREVLTQVFESLSFLHKHGITHGGLCPQSIKIEHSDPWSIKLSDIGLHPMVELEDPGRRYMYLSQQNAGYAKPRPSWDIWPAGVIGMDILFPEELGRGTSASKKSATHTTWMRKLESRATAIYYSERPAPRGRKDAALFLTRVLKITFVERPTAAQCLQDPWLRAKRPALPDQPRQAKWGHGQAGVKEYWSDDDADTEAPRSAISKGKRPETARYPSITAPTNTGIHRARQPETARYPSNTAPTRSGMYSAREPETARYQSNTEPTGSGIYSARPSEIARYPSYAAPTGSGIYSARPSETARYPIITEPDGISMYSSTRQPPVGRLPSLTSPTSTGVSKAKQPPKPHHTGYASSSSHQGVRPFPPQRRLLPRLPAVLGYAATGPAAPGPTTGNPPANAPPHGNAAPSARFYSMR